MEGKILRGPEPTIFHNDGRKIGSTNKKRTFPMKQVINIRFNYSQWSIFFPQIIYNACDFWLECSNFDSELVLFLLHCLRFCSGGNYKILLTIFRPLFILFSFNKMWWILMRLSKSHFYFVAFTALNHYYGAHPAAGKWVCSWFWWTFIVF